MSIDTIGNFLTCIRNALMVSKRSVTVPYSKIRHDIANTLKEEGFIRDVEKIDDSKKKARLVIHLKYVDGESAIHEITRISRPGCRCYEGVKSITPVIGGLGISILTTNIGVITDKQSKKKFVGGEVLCHVW